MLVLLQLMEAGMLSTKNSWMHPRPRSREVMKQVNTIGTDLDLMDADSSNRSYLWSTDPVLRYRKACIARSYGSGMLSTWAEVFDEDMDYMDAEVFDMLFMDYLCRGGIHRRRYLMVFALITPCIFTKLLDS